MSLGLLGKKIGMTRVFNEEGVSIPVTVIDVSDNRVVRLCQSEKDGYSAVVIGYGTQSKPQRFNKPRRGLFEKAGVAPKHHLKEFRVSSDSDLPEKPGEEVPVSTFQVGQFVDVIGTTKGKGFQGVYKRYGFGGLPASHGSMMHRRTGAIAQGSTPGRVWKNTKMPGRQGGDRCTIQNLPIVQVREEDHCILIQGAVPGSRGSTVVVRPSVKKPLPQEKES